MRWKPNAKINLGLHIKGKRADGYHLLETVFMPVIDWYDELEVLPSPQFSIELEGIPIDGNLGSNLCVRAFHAMQTAYEGIENVCIYLKKNIPAGTGLGGGSSDAAHTLLALRQLFRPDISVEELAPIAARLGADVPFFLYNRPLFASGTGTDFSEIVVDFPYQIRLELPDIHSSTVEAYRALSLAEIDHTKDLRTILALPAEQWKYHLKNDLEIPVFKKYPLLAQIKQQFYAQGAIYASMSGSGSAVFGLFPL